MFTKEAQAVPLFLFSAENLERMNRMKHKKNLWSGVSSLIVAVLAITAFLRGAWQFWMLVVSFSIFAVWASVRFLIPYIRDKWHGKEAKKLQRHYEAQARQQRTFLDIDVSEPVSIVLLRHVNHRISAYLQSAYPEATWDWCVDNPEKLVTKGGTGRIKLSGVPDYNFAEISLDQNAKIGCQLLKIVPFGVEQNGAEEKATEEKPKTAPREIDPQVWFEKQGRAVLQNLIADLNSRGHNSLTIEADGSIVITQGDKALKRPAFTNLPSKEYWPRLVNVFARNGMSGEITDSGLVLSW